MVLRQQNQPTNGEKLPENTVTTIVGEVEVILVYFPTSFGNILGKRKEVKQLVRVH